MSAKGKRTRNDVSDTSYTIKKAKIDTQKLFSRLEDLFELTGDGNVQLALEKADSLLTEVKELEKLYGDN